MNSNLYCFQLDRLYLGCQMDTFCLVVLWMTAHVLVEAKNVVLLNFFSELKLKTSHCTKTNASYCQPRFLFGCLCNISWISRFFFFCFAFHGLANLTGTICLIPNIQGNSWTIVFVQYLLNVMIHFLLLLSRVQPTWWALFV